jgi:protein-S-isoprenylcysteine O-methyltransferase Ste14
MLQTGMIQVRMADYLSFAWLAFAGVWLVGALTAKRAVRKESLASRLSYTLPLAVAVALIFIARRPAGLLGWRFVPQSAAAAYAGLAVTVAGLAFAIWARVILGGNWSGTVTIKEGHTLVWRGPYRLVRNPIYTGMWVALIGTAVVHGEARALIGAALVLPAFWLKARVEEKFLAEWFGDEYERYRREVKALIPFVL